MEKKTPRKINHPPSHEAVFTTPNGVTDNCGKLPIQFRDQTTGQFSAASDDHLVYVREINNRMPHLEWDLNHNNEIHLQIDLRVGF